TLGLQTADVGVQVDDVTAADPQRAVRRVALNAIARGLITELIARIERVRRTERGNQVLDLDVEVVDGHRQAGREARREDDAVRVRIGGLGLELGVATLQEVVLTRRAVERRATQLRDRHTRVQARLGRSGQSRSSQLGAARIAV